MGEIKPEKLSKKELLEEYISLRKYAWELLDQIAKLEKEISYLKTFKNYGYISGGGQLHD